MKIRFISLFILLSAATVVHAQLSSKTDRFAVIATVIEKSRFDDSMRNALPGEPLNHFFPSLKVSNDDYGSERGLYLVIPDAEPALDSYEKVFRAGVVFRIERFGVKGEPLETIYREFTPAAFEKRSTSRMQYLLVPLGLETSRDERFATSKIHVTMLIRYTLKEKKGVLLEEGHYQPVLFDFAPALWGP